MDPDIAREQVIDQAARDVRAGRTADPSIVDWIVRDECYHGAFAQELRDVYADEHARLQTTGAEFVPQPW